MKKWLFFLLLAVTPLRAEMSIEENFTQVPDQSGLSILSPTLADRQTAKIRLKNGLEAYLISDPGVEQSAAALAVKAGSWNDPEEYPGMAHFLEHMLFMGTKAYPREFEYMQYINDYGGKVNAYTASDRTVYMFSVNNEGFEGALDRFSHFFIDPLFLPSSIDRELHAVDQEHAKNIENDGWRQYMIFKETGNQQHPNAKFSTGNADTLRGIPRDAMQKWYEVHYNAKEMYLVVLSALPLDQLIEMTIQDFSQITNDPQHTPEVISTSMTSSRQKGKKIYVNPVKDLKVLSLTWEVAPEFTRDNEVRPGLLLSYALKSGSKNSLLGLLKRQHLAEAIHVAEEQLGQKHRLFTIDVELTQKGLDQVDDVITHCFEALARLKKTKFPRYLFDEVQIIEELKYTYQSRQDAFEFVRENVHALVDESLETFPKKTLIPTKYDPKMIDQYIHQLTPEECLYFVIAPPEKTGVAVTHKEKWMGAEYTLKPLDEKEITQLEKVGINPQIGLPPPNPYIPTNLTLVHSQKSEQAFAPILLQNDAKGKVYFASDETYLVPEVAYLYRIKSPLLDGSASSQALSDLFLKAVYDELFSVTSAAEAAGANIGISQDHLALAIAVNAYSDGSMELTQEIFQKMTKMKPSQEQFDLYKQSLTATYENSQKELPYLQSLEVLNSIIFNDAPTSGDKLSALKQIRYHDFLDFTNRLFKQTYVEGLIYGNLTQEEGEKLWTTLSHKMSSSGYPIEEQYKRQILILSKGHGPYMVMQPTNMQGNATLLMIDQGPYSFEKRASQQIIGKVLKSDFFETLRTKQQTAYIAKAWEKEEEKELVQFFGVQSSTHKPSELIVRFELFLENFIKQFTTKLPQERFENLRQMTITSLEMPPENLMLSGIRLFLLGFDYDGEFDLIQKRIQALRDLTYEQLKEDASAFLSRNNTRRIAVLVEGLTPGEKSFRYEEVSIQDLRHLGQYVAWK